VIRLAEIIGDSLTDEQKATSWLKPDGVFLQADKNHSSSAIQYAGTDIEPKTFLWRKGWQRITYYSYGTLWANNPFMLPNDRQKRLLIQLTQELGFNDLKYDNNHGDRIILWSKDDFLEEGKKSKYDEIISHYKSIGANLQPLCSISNYTIYYIKDETPKLWLSGGIHGDEPAGVYALLATYKKLKKKNIPCIVFPCLNPWGLDNKKRRDKNGIDLNHVYDGDGPIKEIEHQKKLISPVELVLCFHEDYDANGCYVWKSPDVNDSIAKKILNVSSVIDNRKNVEGYESRNGIIDDVGKSDEGASESVWLYDQGIKNTFVLESNSTGRNVKDRAKDLVNMAITAVNIFLSP